jgi:hypothetical protein
MAAKLEWRGDALWLGDFVLGETKRVTGVTGVTRTWRYWAGRNQSELYESISECQQDCESEVRRLLKTAGVEIE